MQSWSLILAAKMFCHLYQPSGGSFITNIPFTLWSSPGKKHGWLKINCSVNQSSHAKLGPAWHNKKRWVGMGWEHILGQSTWVNNSKLLLSTREYNILCAFKVSIQHGYNIPQGVLCFQQTFVTDTHETGILTGCSNNYDCTAQPFMLYSHFHLNFHYHFIKHLNTNIVCLLQC